MGFLGFLIKKKFYIHLVVALAITLLLVLVSFGLIKSYTRYGEAIVLPDFTGMTMDDLEEKELSEVFDLIIIDSVFANDLQPGSIIKQNPSPYSKVKRNRNIYITVVALNPEKTTMPDLKDLTVRQAQSLLKTNGLKIRKLLFTPDIADNAVIGHYFNGDTVESGEELLSGSEIDLLIGQANNIPGPVPFLIGRDKSAAVELLLISSFNIGSMRYWDTLAMKDGKVYQQSPEWTEELRRGENVNLWLRSPTQFDFDSLVESLMPDTTLIDEQTPGLPGDTIIFEE